MSAKNYLMIVLAVVFVIGFQACGGDDEDSLCEPWCEKNIECDDNVDEGYLDSCIKDCKKAESEDESFEECRKAIKERTECAIMLSCEGFKEWEDKSDDSYPCQEADEKMWEVCDL